MLSCGDSTGRRGRREGEACRVKGDQSRKVTTRSRLMRVGSVVRLVHWGVLPCHFDTATSILCLCLPGSRFPSAGPESACAFSETGPRTAHGTNWSAAR